MMDKQDAREIYGLLRDIKADIASLKTALSYNDERIKALEDKFNLVKSYIDRETGVKAVLIAVASAIGAGLVLFIQYILGIK